MLNNAAFHVPGHQAKGEVTLDREQKILLTPTKGLSPIGNRVGTNPDLVLCFVSACHPRVRSLLGVMENPFLF